MCTAQDVDFPLLERWKSAAQVIACGPPRLFPWQSRGGPQGEVTGHSIRQHRHLGDDAFFVVRNLCIDPLRLTRRYTNFRGGETVEIERGALRVATRRTAHWRAATAPLALGVVKKRLSFGALPSAERDDGITLVVLRDGAFNVFHSMADLIHAFFMRHMFSYQRIVFFDGLPEGPFYPLWSLLSPQPVISHEQLPAPTIFSTAVISPPGGCCLLWKNRSAAREECRITSPLLQAFRHFVIEGLQLSAPPHSSRVITVVGRTVRHGSAQATRRIVNEEALCDRLARESGWEVRRVDFATLELREQIRAALESDVLVGMHGAGLTHALWLRPNAALVELFPSPTDRPACFGNIATWVGARYASWTNERVSPDQAAMGLQVPAVEVDAGAIAAAIRAVLGGTDARPS